MDPSVVVNEALVPPQSSPASSSSPAFKYKGRVRTGCLTCRKRKVKCDEQRPCCRNCTGSKTQRPCIYPPRKVRGVVTNPPVDNETTCPIDSEIVAVSDEERDLHTWRTHHDHTLHFPDCERSFEPQNTSQGIHGSRSTIEVQSSYAFNSPPISATDGESNMDENTLYPSTLSLMTSQDISICTTIDFLAACNVSDTPSLMSFIDEVNPPVIAAYDPVNWQRIKILCVDVACRNKTVRDALLAVQSLYNAQLAGLTTSYALALYRTASDDFRCKLDGGGWDFDTVLITTFLLALCEMLAPEETQSILSLSEGQFIVTLETVAAGGRYSPVAKRLSTWLNVIHPTTRRGGNPGILSDAVARLLPSCAANLPSLSVLDTESHSFDLLFDTLSTPIFAFYRELQNISTEIAALSHYHRSRTTGQDQDEVGRIMAQIKSRLYTLWQCRPGPISLEPATIRTQLSPAIAEPLIELVGITTASYHAEIVEMGRTLSEPPLASLEAKRSMRSIRSLVEDRSWNAYGFGGEDQTPKSKMTPPGRLHPGYLRPLFMYAIESINEADTQWAIERIRHINNNVCKNEFFALFAESLAAAQRNKGRRVTTKWFCCEKFGISPPYL